MKLVENAGAVVKHSWSVRLIALAGILETVSLASPMLLPELSNFVTPEQLSIVSLVLVLSGLVARIIKQTKVSG